MYVCPITRKQNGLYPLRVFSDDGSMRMMHVDGDAWDAIASIAKLALADDIQSVQDQVTSFQSPSLSTPQTYTEALQERDWRTAVTAFYDSKYDRWPTDYEKSLAERDRQLIGVA